MKINFKLFIKFEELKNIDNKLLSYPKAKLLIVTKNRPKNLVLDLIKMGYDSFGENRVQEAFDKYHDIQNDNISLHLIGPLQSNKTKTALELFDTIQTVDRPKLILEISKLLKNLSKTQIKTKEFYIQVNIGREIQKSGVFPNNIEKLYDLCIKNNLIISGLMCIPPKDKDPKIYFNEMIDLRDKVNPLLKLSMGMSEDYEIALDHQSNCVRIGSRIFK